MDFLRIRSACFLNSILFLSTDVLLSFFIILFSIMTFKSLGLTPKPFKTLIAVPSPSLRIPRKRCSTPILSSPSLRTSSLT